ncbi:MAG: aminotransferase class III-fold pyridoxal phosphate-dependent enzyme, partial [Chlamydiota bacterium]
PVAGNMGVVPASRSFMNLLRKITEEEKTLLIFDEVMTGFRFSKGSAQSYYGITPDITTLGKIVGGGFPVACLGGRKEIMRHLAPEGTVYQAGTLAGNPVAMAAGLASLKLLDKENFYEELQEKADFLLQPVEEAIKGKKACLNRVGSMFTLFFGPEKVTEAADIKHLDNERFKNFYHAMLSEGLYFSPAHNEASFISQAHSFDDLLKTREVLLNYVCKYL